MAKTSLELVVDIGNSAAKIAVYDSGHIVWRESYDDVSIFDFKDVISRFSILQGILSTTREHDLVVEDFLRNNLEKFVVFDPASTPIPLKNRYNTPRTLGSDRLAAAVAAWTRFEGEDIVVIDLGTAITVDFVSRRGEYLGGNISPGMFLRFSSLHRQTAKLPLYNESYFSDNESFGVDTRSAIVQGTIRGIVYEIEGYIDQNKGSKIFFTGGDALFFEKQIKKPIFVDHDAVLGGLHSILKYDA